MILLLTICCQWHNRTLRLENEISELQLKFTMATQVLLMALLHIHEIS